MSFVPGIGAVQTCAFHRSDRSNDRGGGPRELEPPFAAHDETRLCPMRAGDRSVLLLFKKGATADTDAIGAIHIAFGIARRDLPAWERWLKEQGISIELRKTWKYYSRSGCRYSGFLTPVRTTNLKPTSLRDACPQTVPYRS
jgi:hypothetical protein